MPLVTFCLATLETGYLRDRYSDKLVMMIYILVTDYNELQLLLAYQLYL